MSTNGMLNKVHKLFNIFYLQHSPCHTNNVVKCWKWDVYEFIRNQLDTKYAVLVLNRSISQNQDFIRGFWNNATVRMTVDGGTVHWDKFLNTLPEHLQKTMKLPDFITGDFDSITEEVLEKYKKKGCKAIHTPDQNHTDFTKALMQLNSHCKDTDIQLDNVIAIVQSSGRIDQILGNIQTLHLVKEMNLFQPHTKMYILSDDSISWLLEPGDHIINVPEESRRVKKAWCALVPIGEACQNVTTSGLKWNLDKQQLKYGRIVSTSNAFDGSEQVKIKCSHTLLWAMKVPGLVNK